MANANALLAGVPSEAPAKGEKKAGSLLTRPWEVLGEDA